MAPRIGGIPEVVLDGETGVLLREVTPDALAGACIALLTDPARARTLGTAAQERIAAEFSAEQMAAATAVLYGEVLERQRAAGGAS